MRSFTARRGNAITMDIVAPIEEGNPANHTPVSGATIVAYVLDPAVRNRLREDVSSGSTLKLLSVSGFVVGHEVEVQLDDGSRHDAGAVTAVRDATDVSPNELDVTNAVPSLGSIGRRVMRRLGSPITTGSMYGTASLAGQDWGYVAEIPRTHEGFEQRLRQLLIEGVIDATSGSHYERAWKVIVTDALARP